MRRAGLLLALLALPLPGCEPRPELRLAGRTMGTTWHVTVVGRGSTADLQGSTSASRGQPILPYREDSEIRPFTGSGGRREFPSPGDCG
jgi:hypothetical protein